MAFNKKTWKDRISEYPNRRTINDGYVTKQVTVGRDEGTVTEEGDAFNASNMNDLETRIEAAIASGGSSYVDVTGTLEAGQTEITLSNASITPNSTIDYYTNVFGVNPTNAVVSAGSVTLTFEARATDLGVKVRVS